MKTFTIDEDNNILAWATRTAALAQPVASKVFDSPETLATVAGGKRLVEVWNSLTGVTPVTKFTSALVGAKRTFAKLETLEVSDSAATEPGTPFDEPAPEAPTAAKAAKKKTAASKGAKKASKPARAAKVASDGPRATSKTAQLIEMLKRKNGATLEEIMSTFGWQVHTARALMSAGGALAKKHGLTVISEKNADGARSYRIAK